MRIISGRFRGRRLPVPVGASVRPTTDRVREAVFSAIGRTVESAQVLDLFCGTGAYGFEALSRGASGVVFVDSDRKLMRGIAHMADALRVTDRLELMEMDYSIAIGRLQKRGNTFDIIFVDPPYSSEFLRELVSDPLLIGILGESGLLVTECRNRPEERLVSDALFTSFGGRYGDTRVTIYSRKTWGC